MIDMPPLYILRHGETVWNKEGRLQGWLDSPLTERGKAQALQQRTILDGLASRDRLKDVVIRASPQPRAYQTAKISCENLGAQRIVMDPRLKEVRLGDWEGRYVADVAPKACEVPWQFSSPNGERLEAMITRLTAFCESLTRPTILVTHGFTACVLRGHLLQHPRRLWGTLSMTQGVVFKLADGKEEILTD